MGPIFNLDVRLSSDSLFPYEESDTKETEGFDLRLLRKKKRLGR